MLIHLNKSWVCWNNCIDEVVAWLIWWTSPSSLQFKVVVRLALRSAGCAVTPWMCTLNCWKHLFMRWPNLPHSRHWGLLFPNPLPLPISLPYLVQFASNSEVICYWFWWFCPVSGSWECPIYVKLEFVLIWISIFGFTATFATEIGVSNIRYFYLASTSKRIELIATRS